MFKMKELTPLGDRHNGKSTCLVREDDGREYIYKPRSAEIERAWSRFLNGLHDAGLVLLPKYTEILTENGDEHTEAVVQHRETDVAGLRRYAKRCGTLLFLTYLLGSTDLHAENLIASGEYPVLVDLETLLSGFPARSRLQGTMVDTVLRSFLLPHFVDRTDLGGMTSLRGNASNLPICDGEPAQMWQYADEIAEGFTAAYHFGMAHRELLAQLLCAFAPCRFRFLLRKTTVYGKIIHNLNLTPEQERAALADGYLRRAYAKDADPTWQQRAEKMLQAEVDAVLRGDVPLFYVRGDQCDLLCGDDTVMPQFMQCAPVAFARRRLASLSEDDLKKQLQILRLSLGMLTPAAPPSEAACEDVLTRIGEELLRCEVPQHATAFAALQFDRTGFGSLQSVGFGLYDGLTGILCTFAALCAKNGADRWQQAFARFLTQIEAQTVTPAYRTPVSDASCCLSDGLGGMIAALLHVAELTGQQRPYDDALALAKKLDPAKTENCTADLLGGAAGICLSLPKLPQEIAVPIAKTLFPVLMNAESALTGAAHGAAGHALALGALQTVLQTDAADEKILSLLRWEDAQYVPLRRNWKDLRDPERLGFMRGWCSGAPGIGMCRKKLLSYTKNGEIAALCRLDLQSVREFLLPPMPYPTASLCCGEAARVMAASCLGVPVEHQLSRIVRADAPELYHPMNTADAGVSLMQGLAGIGYALAMEGDERSGGMLL